MIADLSISSRLYTFLLISLVGDIWKGHAESIAIPNFNVKSI